MTAPDCVSAGLGIDVIEADAVPNVRDLFEAWFSNDGEFPSAVERDKNREYVLMNAYSAWEAFKAGYRAAGGQGA